MSCHRAHDSAGHRSETTATRLSAERAGLALYSPGTIPGVRRGRIRERYRPWADSGITGLTIVAEQPEALELMADLARA